MVVGPSRFEIPPEAGRLRVRIENSEGPPTRTLTYVKRHLIFFLLSSYNVRASCFFH
jgi:hypothetical protein